MFKTWLAILLCLSMPLSAKSFSFDPDFSKISFSIPYLTFFTVEGQFDDASGVLKMDSNGNVTSIVMKVDTDSLHLVSDEATKYVLGSDMLNAKKNKKIYFKSLRIVHDANQLIANGLFDINGVTKKIDFPITVKEFKSGDDRYVLIKANPILKREHFGISTDKRNKDGVLEISSEVNLDLELVFKEK